MTSSDLELARYIDARLDRTESNLRIYVDEKINEVKIYVDKKIDALDEKVTKLTETQASIRHDVDILIGKFDGIQSSFNAMTVIIGFLGVAIPAFCFFLTKYFDRQKAENSESLSPKQRTEITELIRAEFAAVK